MFDALLLGVALAMDSLTMSIVNGLKYSDYSYNDRFLSSFSFGFFQGMMPFLGYVLFLPVINYIENYDHWAVLLILSFLGIRMILDSFKNDEDSGSGESFSLKVMLLESVATSIDALSSCVILPSISLPPVVSCLIIFAVTFLICLVGHRLGNRMSVILKDKASIFGGVILIVLGVKCVLEHLEII